MAGPDPAVAQVRHAVRAVLRTVGQPSHRSVLVACSGGPDSVALAAALAFEAPRLGVPAGLVTVDHGLQPDAAQRAADVVALGERIGLTPSTAVRVDVDGAGGPEAAARRARYEALEAAAAPTGALVLLGHTLDDQAETVLLGLGRGSGPRSIAGMPAATGRYRRPLLGLRRATTRAACAAEQLPVWDDPHNRDPSFQRARLRHEVLPLLEDVLQGGVAEALARTAALLRDDLGALDHWAGEAYAVALRPGGELCVPGLVDLPAAVRTRVLRRWADPQVPEPLSAERTQALDALVTGWHGQGPLDLPGGVTVERRSDRLVLVSRAKRGSIG